MYALELKNLRKTFDDIVAVDDVSFSVPEGSVFGLIGRNGAGKTTTIRLMMNIYMPEAGEVILRGIKAGPEFKEKVGYLPEERGLYKKMRVLETILYFAEIKGKNKKEVENRAVDYLHRFELYDRRMSKVQDLSKGNQQKVQFISTIIHDPDFVIFDEPFSGLDPINTNLLKDIILEMKEAGKVIIFSTHLMDFAEKLCDHIAMIDQGKIIIEGALSKIKSEYGQKNLSLTYEGDISFLKTCSYIDKIEDFGNTTGIRVKEPGQIQEVLKMLVDRNVIVKKFDANDISLQEIFIELAGNEDGKGGNRHA
jgi:ABC-2 type transport system ATP-binding protein